MHRARAHRFRLLIHRTADKPQRDAAGARGDAKRSRVGLLVLLALAQRLPRFAVTASRLENCR